MFYVFYVAFRLAMSCKTSIFKIHHYARRTSHDIYKTSNHNIFKLDRPKKGHLSNFATTQKVLDVKK